LITLRHKKIGMNSDTRPEINYTKHKHKVCVRCSRPLCSSQKTDGNPNQPHPLIRGEPLGPAGQKTQTTTLPVSSGPNSVLTQFSLVLAFPSSELAVLIKDLIG